MKFTKKEINELLEYVALNVMNAYGISLEESRELVKNSVIVSKIKTAPNFIAHCSMSQLVDMVENERLLSCI